MIASKDKFSQAIETLVDERDETTLAVNTSADDAKYMVVLADGSIVTILEQTALLPKNDIVGLSINMDSRVYLGQSDEGPIIAVQSQLVVADLAAQFSSSKPSDLLGDMMFSDIDREAVSRGCSLLNWNKSQSFCGGCAAPTRSTLAGFRRDCPSCQATYFPRIDPTVIMLPVHEQRCLLGRNSKFSAGWYTALSGFVEPGETLESAIFREVREEAGVTVSSVRLHSSQPWPFPHSIMVGAICDVSDPTIRIENLELEDCRWFTREETAQIRSNSHPSGFRNTSKNTLAAKLIDDWLRL